MSQKSNEIFTNAAQINKGKIKSPCVNNCCLDQEDICLGCYRHIKEIVGWKNLSDEDKKSILQSCDTRKASMKQKSSPYTHPSRYS